MSNKPINCDRCQTGLRTAEEMAGAILVRFESPIMPVPSSPAVLCDECGKRVAEFIFPEIVNEPHWRKVQAGR